MLLSVVKPVTIALTIKQKLNAPRVIIAPLMLKLLHLALWEPTPIFWLNQLVLTVQLVTTAEMM